MPTNAPNWSTRRVTATFVRRDLPDTLTLYTGTYRVTASNRIVNIGTDGIKRIFPEGVILNAQPLHTIASGYSLDIQLPTVDDADNFPQGGKYLIDITLDAAGVNAGQTLRYEISTSEDLDPTDHYDLGDLTPDVVIPVIINVLGKPGGVALLNRDGAVIDAFGNLVTGDGAVDPAALQTVLDSGAITFPEELKGDPGTPGTPGTPGKDGASVNIAGTVANQAALPTGLGAGDAGKGYYANDTGLLFVWGGTAYGTGILIRGPQGTPGSAATLPDYDMVAVYTSGVNSTVDSTPPAITSFQVTPGADAVTVAWTGNDAVSFVKEFVVRRGTTSPPTTVIYTGSATTFTDTGLTVSTLYYYSVTAKDFANNVSTPSTSATPPTIISTTTLAIVGQAFADAFTRSNTTGGWGNGWSVYGTGTNTGTIAANVAKVPSTASGTVYLFKAPIQPSSNNHWAQLDVTAAPTGSSRIYAGPVVGATDNGSDPMTGYTGFWSATGGTSGTGGWSISRRTSPVTVLATVDATEPTLPKTLRLEKNGNVLTLKVAGSTVLTTTDATPVPTGRGTGVFWYSTLTTSNEAIDNFACGNL